MNYKLYDIKVRTDARSVDGRVITLESYQPSADTLEGTTFDKIAKGDVLILEKVEYEVTVVAKPEKNPDLYDFTAVKQS